MILKKIKMNKKGGGFSGIILMIAIVFALAIALIIFSNAYRCSGTRISPMKRKIAYFNKADGTWKLVGISKGFATLY